MNEKDGFKISVHHALRQDGFYVKKFADKVTQGIPDTFACKLKKGIFLELKFINLKNWPTEFSQWSAVTKQMVQLMTMFELNRDFVSRYLIGYGVDMETKIAIIKPHILLNGKMNNAESIEIELLSMNLCIQELNRILQL